MASAVRLGRAPYGAVTYTRAGGPRPVRPAGRGYVSLRAGKPLLPGPRCPFPRWCCGSALFSVVREAGVDKGVGKG